MATIGQNYQDEDDQQDPAGGPTTVAGTAGAGSEGIGQGGAAAPVSNVKQNDAAQANNGYTDVASYLNANKEGSAKLGQQVTTNLNNKYGATKQGAQDSFGQFQGDVNSGYTQENSDLISQVAADPLAAANNQDQLTAFQKQLNNTYTGPNSWGDFGTQQGKINEATQYGDLSKTPGGLNVYAQEVEGQTGGPQSQGINQLDTLLLGGDANAMGQVKGAANQYKDLNDYINAMNTQGLNDIGGARTAAANSSQHALDAFTGSNGVLTNLNASINNNANEAQKNALQRQQDLMGHVQGIYNQPVDTKETTLGTYGGGSTPWYNSTNYSVNNTLSPQDLADLGIDANQWQALQAQMQRAGTSEYKTGHNFGAASPTSQIDISQFLTGLDPNNINASTVASAGDYAKTDAIQKLLGSKTPQGNALNPALASLAGTAPKDLTDFNYNNALDYSTIVSDEERRAAQDMANQLTGQADKAHADSQHGGFLDKLKNILPLANPVGFMGNKFLLDQGKKLSK